MNKYVPQPKSQEEIIQTFRIMIGVMAVAIIALIIVLIFLFCGKPQEVEDTPPITSTSETASEPEPEATEETAFPESVYATEEEATWQGKNGLFTGTENGELVWKKNKEFVDTYCTEASAVPGVKTAIGNQVYAVPESAFEGTAVGDHDHEREMVYIQLFGYTPSLVDSDGWMSSLENTRQEFTGKRVYVFDQPYALEQYQRAWDEGQAILSGEKEAEDNAIIINGRLSAIGKTIKTDDEIYIPMEIIGEEANKDSFRNDIEKGTVTIGIPSPYGSSYLTIPYEGGGIGGFGSTFTAGNFDDAAGPLWSDEFQVGKTTNCYVPISEVARYTGWYFTEGKNYLSIVTDETDVSDIFIMNTRTNRSASEQLRYGDSYVTYNDGFDAIVQPAETAQSESEGGE